MRGRTLTAAKASETPHCWDHPVHGRPRNQRIPADRIIRLNIFYFFHILIFFQVLRLIGRTSMQQLSKIIQKFMRMTHNQLQTTAPDPLAPTDVMVWVWVT